MAPLDKPVSERLIAHRVLLEHLEWVIADPLSTDPAMQVKREREAEGLRREIARLEDYARLGIVFEPNF